MAQPEGESVFKDFTVLEKTFKTVDGHNIQTAVIYPKNLKPGAHPIAYHLHGGFLIFGDAVFEPFFPPWLLQLATDHGAVIVSPDYRLLPTANGLPDVIEDLEDGWQWTKDKLPAIFEAEAPGCTLDFSQVFLLGGSAGGYCSLQLGLSYPEDFRLLSAIYPMVDLKDPLYATGLERGQPNILHFNDADIPSEEAALAWVEKTRAAGAISRAGFERTPITISLCHNGHFLSKIADNKGLNEARFFPPERVAAGAKLPPKLWLLHGAEDSAVPIRGAHKFAELVKTKLPEVEVRFDVIPDQDHGFDMDPANWADHSAPILQYVADSWFKKG